MGFCSPCRGSLGLPPVPKPIRSRVWTEKERMTVPAPPGEGPRTCCPAGSEDPFIGVNGQDLDVGMRHTGAGGIR